MQPKESNRKPNGSQTDAKREPKSSQKISKIKKALPKAPLRNRDEINGKIDAKRMTMYPKRVPT